MRHTEYYLLLTAYYLLLTTYYLLLTTCATQSTSTRVHAHFMYDRSSRHRGSAAECSCAAPCVPVLRCVAFRIPCAAPTIHVCNFQLLCNSVLCGGPFCHSALKSDSMSAPASPDRPHGLETCTRTHSMTHTNRNTHNRPRRRNKSETVPTSSSALCHPVTRLQKVIECRSMTSPDR